ncbi:MAG: hypothetical protein LQ342_008472 [Letrouitia transgressa]|nr:MAG: hypothetical protein LQ342_008472 [Letrouitia transgressa]
MASTWKKSRDNKTKVSQTKLLNYARKFFTVDASGSTMGNIINKEAVMVHELSGNLEDSVTKWGSSCDRPILLKTIPYPDGSQSNRYWFGDRGGTYPETILEQDAAIQRIRQCNLWYLMTDGEVRNRDVQALTNLSNSEHLTNVPVCIVIFGNKTSSPALTNVSVGIPFYVSATEAMILFKDIKSDQIWVIASKGIFSSLSNATNELDLSSWENLACFKNEEDLKRSTLQIEITAAEDRIDTSAVSLGPEWNHNMKVLVDVDALLQQQKIDGADLARLLKEDTFQQLALVCKIRNQLTGLRDLISRHKQQRVAVTFKDLHGASVVLKKIRTKKLGREELNQLESQLRDAHAANRRTYEFQRNHPSNEVRQADETNRLIDRALAILANLERSEYTADILDRKSNRARRADLLSRQDAAIHYLTLDLSRGDAYRSTCNICCGEDQIMSVFLNN